MKLAGFLILAPVGLGLLAAAEPDPPKLSARLRQEITVSLPAYVPPPVSPVATAAPSSDSDVFVLPKLTVQERPLPRIEAIDLLTKAARKKKLARDFRNSFKGLDAILNGFSIPILSPTMAERGWKSGQTQRLQELNEMAQSVKTVDPAASAGLRKSVNETQRALDAQDRPAGEK